VVELGLHGTQTGSDVGQTLATGQLRKGETQELIETGKAEYFVLASTARDALAEFVEGWQVRELGKNGSSSERSHRIVRWRSGSQTCAAELKSIMLGLRGNILPNYCLQRVPNSTWGQPCCDIAPKGAGDMVPHRAISMRPSGHCQSRWAR